MATLFQLLILAQVYLYSRGETPCSLLQTCSLEFNEPLMIDAQSMDPNAEARFTCPVPSSPQGNLEVEWFVSNTSTEMGMQLVTSNSQGSMFFRESPNVLVVSEVGGRYEGFYNCRITEDGENPMQRDLGCLIVLGRGVFASCPNSIDPGCIDDTITVPRGGIGVLDTRVTFRDGGPCANQGVRVLRVEREQQAGVFVYLCSNLAGFQGQPCTNELYPRFTVVDAGGCSPQVACKYNIFLNLTNFNDSDADVYTIEVVFEPLGDTMQRVLQRRISLQIGPAEITTDPRPETTTASPTGAQQSASNGGAIAGGIVGGIFAVVLAVIITVTIIIVLWHCKRSHSNSNEDAIPMKVDRREEVYYPESIVTEQPRSEKTLSVLEPLEDNQLPPGINSPAVNV